MKTLDFAQLKEMVSVIDVAKHLGYSDRTQWARSKRSVRNPCYESPNGDKIIITNPTDYSRQVYRNPYDSSDYGDVISFVGKRLKLDAKGITEYLTNFNKNVPVIKQQEQKKIDINSKEFQSHYFKLSVLSGANHHYLLRRKLSDETLYSPAFKDVFKDVQIPIFAEGKFVKHSDRRYIGVTYHTDIYSPVSGIDYRNSEVKKFGITSQKSVSIGFSNIPAVIKNIKIAESPIDAASHYQLNPENNETLYIFTGGNLSLGQLMAIDKVINSQPNEVHTTLLFDKDVAGAIYDLNFLCHRLENPLTNSVSIEELQLFDKEQTIFPEISVQQSLQSVSLSININTLSPDQVKRIFNCEKAFNLSCVAKENMLMISADKNYEEVSKLVELTKHVFPILSSITIEKTPIGKDWNNYLNKDQEESKSIVFDAPAVSDANPLYDREYTSDFMEALEEGLFPENKNNKPKSKESPLVGYQFEEENNVYEIYAIRPDGKVYFHELNDNTKEYNIHIDQFFQQLRNKEILPSQFNTVEKRNYAINYMNEFYPEKLPTENLNNNQAAKPEILSQNKMNHMSTQNAGEQNTQKTPAEKLQGTMKLLGLKDVWEIIKPAFESWANDPNEEGRKSFKVENLTFRRTGFKDDAKGISTDMLANVELNFNKKNGTVYFNSFTPELMNSIIVKIKEPQSIKHTFDVFLKKEDAHSNLTLKAALNLLDGRSVHIIDNNWIKYDQASKKIAEFKFDLERAIKENKKMDFSSTKPEHMDSALTSLLKGDFAMIGCTIDDKPVTIFLTADAQYKKIESNDSNLYKHLNQEERKARDEKLNLKQDEVQGKSMHP